MTKLSGKSPWSLEKGSLQRRGPHIRCPYHFHVVRSVDVGKALKSQVSERNRRMVMGTLAEKQAPLQCLLHFLGAYKVQVCGFDSTLNSVSLKI